jgi:adenylate cyclase
VTTQPPPPTKRRAPLLSAIHLAGIALAITCTALLGGIFPTWFSTLDQRLGDTFWSLNASETPEQRLIIVDIDEASINELGPWPWPRSRLAQLSERLASAGVGLQIFDIVLNAEQADDPAAAQTLKMNNALHAQLMALDQGAPTRSGHLPSPDASPNVNPNCQPPIPEAHGYIASASAYAQIPSGHITPRVSPDGIIRQQPAYICSEGHAFPALGLAAYLRGAGVIDPPTIRPGRHWLEASWLLEIPSLKQTLPLNERGDLNIPYRIDPGAMLTVSAADVLAGRIPDELLKGRWALISSTSFGLGDVVSTPFGGAQSGVSVHLQILAGLLDDQIPYPFHGQTLIQSMAASLSILLLLLLLALFHLQRWPGYGITFAGLTLAGLLIAGQAWAQLHHGWLVGMSLPALATILSASFLGLAELVRTQEERTRILIHLASYLPSPVAEKLLAQVPQAKVIAERRNVAALYADIRNFSAYCEVYEAEKAAGVLHQFLSTTSQIVEAHGGLIESMHGDAILAVWNGSLACSNPANEAIHAALEMLTAIEPQLPQNPNNSPDIPPPLALGIGLEYGPALIGSFGPLDRRVHTVLGKTISIAIRLQGLTADLAWPILAGSGLIAQLQAQQNLNDPNHPKFINASFLPQGEFLLEGLTQSCPVHAVSPKHP